MLENSISFDDESFWVGLEIHDRVSVWWASLAAFDTWESAAIAEIEALEQEPTKNLSDHEAIAFADHIDTRKQMLGETKEFLQGSFAVSIFSSLENLCKSFLKRNGHTLTERAVWGEVRSKLESVAGDLSKLPGFEKVNLVRLLNNCFKHNDNRVDADLAKVTTLKAESIIIWGDEPWQEIINGSAEFLLAVKDHFPWKKSPEPTT